MNKIAHPIAAAKAITVGELISKLCGFPDHAVVTFRCPLQHQELNFFRIEAPRSGAVEIELDAASEVAPVVPE